MVCIQGTGPRVSMVMAVHNAAGFLREAVDSILAQTFTDFELVILDDGSTDATAAILRGAAATDSRVTVVTQQHLGIPRSLNKGTAMARGTYVARQDGDDLSLPERLAKQVDFLDRHPDHAMVGSFARWIDERGAHLKTIALPLDNDDIQQNLPGEQAFVHASLMIRRSCLQEVGGYRTEFPLAADVDLSFRLAERFKVANLAEVLYCYRRTAGSVSVRRPVLQHSYTEIAKELARQRHASGTDILMRGTRGLAVATSTSRETAS